MIKHFCFIGHRIECPSPSPESMFVVQFCIPFPALKQHPFRSAQWLGTLPLALRPQPNIPHNTTKMSYFSLSPMAQKQCKVHFPQLHDSQNKFSIGFVSLSLENLKKYVPRFPRPSGPKQNFYLCFLSLSLVSQNLLAFVVLNLTTPTSNI